MPSERFSEQIAISARDLEIWFQILGLLDRKIETAKFRTLDSINLHIEMNRLRPKDQTLT